MNEMEKIKEILNRPNFDVMFGHNDKLMTDLASALIQAGYVKLKDVEIDREKLEQILLTTPYQVEMQNQIKNYVNAIAQVRPLKGVKG